MDVTWGIEFGAVVVKAAMPVERELWIFFEPVADVCETEAIPVLELNMMQTDRCASYRETYVTASSLFLGRQRQVSL